MSYEESPEPIDFDFFAEDDEDIRSGGRNSSRHSTTLTTAATANKSSRPVSASSRPVSASSARSLSSRSSISVKIPSAGPTGVRENAYTFKSMYSDSSDEDNYGYAVNKGRRYDNRNKVEPNKDAVNRPRGDDHEDGSGGEGDSLKKAASSRPKTSKGPRSGRAHKQRDRSSSSDSKSKSRHSSSSFSSKSEHSDSYTSVSDTDSDVTDVSPLPSPARSPTPRLEYDQDDFEDSFEEIGFRQAQEKSSSINNGNGRQNKKRDRKKESVRFAAVTPNNGSTSQRDKRMDETEARELSRLLRAVLQLEETPNHSQMNSFNRSPARQRPSSAKRASTSTAPMPHQRVNLSFSNDKVRQIDRENQRLLQKILRRPKSAVAATGLAPTRKQVSDQPRMMSHSAIRRQREQRKIDTENRKILQRIETAHASSAMQRTSLLHDHDRHMKYASQVSKGSMRPTSSRNTGHNYSGSLSKGSSLASLNSEASRTSTASTGSRRMRPSSGRSMPPPPQGPRQAWEDRW